jgi:hypothetical protein
VLGSKTRAGRGKLRRKKSEIEAVHFQRFRLIVSIGKHKK